jgi:peptide-methionine (S)-S-oxide reductase
MKNTETAVFGGGCFWCLEAVFARLKGVISVRSGYSGGCGADAAYDKVCSGNTDHAEVVSITYDPSVISYERLLEVFFYVHDPTTLDRQGADAGRQYRSVIFYETEKQRAVAELYIKKLNDLGKFKDPVVTETVPLECFYPAEDYHSSYFEKKPAAPYCSFVISPKVKKFEQQFFDLLK